MTYQRNMGFSEAFVRGWRSPRSEDALHDPVEDRVEYAEVRGHDRDEDEGDRGGLDQGVAIRPLNPLQLCPARGEEPEHAAALALARGRRLLAGPAPLRVLG